jgi:hypothetical protein
LLAKTGGGRSFNVAKFLAQTAISSRLDTIAAMAKLSGTTKTQSNSRLITTTAKLRLFYNTACSEIMKDHVATITVVAQTIAPRNGRKIRIVDPIRARINKTASTLRAMSD